MRAPYDDGVNIQVQMTVNDPPIHFDRVAFPIPSHHTKYHIIISFTLHFLYRDFQLKLRR